MGPAYSNVSIKHLGNYEKVPQTFYITFSGFGQITLISYFHCYRPLISIRIFD
jgi:hypothetical protein